MDYLTRDQAEVTVEKAEAAKRAIAERRAELARTRGELEGREAELAAAVSRQRETLAATRERADDLSDHHDGEGQCRPGRGDRLLALTCVSDELSEL